MTEEIERRPHGRRMGWLRNGNSPCELSALPRCNAKAKSTGEQCKQPAMKNGKCYWHGGKSSGPPKNNINALKHGLFTAEAIEERRFIRRLIKETKNLMEETSVA